MFCVSKLSFLNLNLYEFKGKILNLKLHIPVQTNGRTITLHQRQQRNSMSLKQTGSQTDAILSHET